VTLPARPPYSAQDATPAFPDRFPISSLHDAASERWRSGRVAPAALYIRPLTPYCHISQVLRFLKTCGSLPQFEGATFKNLRNFRRFSLPLVSAEFRLQNRMRCAKMLENKGLSCVEVTCQADFDTLGVTGSSPVAPKK
jgi:hypothetical protein